MNSFPKPYILAGNLCKSFFDFNLSIFFNLLITILSVLLILPISEQTEVPAQLLMTSLIRSRTIHTYNNMLLLLHSYLLKKSNLFDVF